MSALELGRPKRSFAPGPGVIYTFLIAIVIVGGYFLIPRFEWHKPQIKITPDSETLGLGTLQIEVTEQGTGLKSFSAVLNSGGTDYPLASEQYSELTLQKKLTVVLSSKLAGLKEGPAVLRISARDNSLWNLFRGNETAIQKNLTIDITPPTLEIVADDRYVNFGGVGMIVYKPSADTVTTGIKIGNYFFPGYKGQITSHPEHYVAFFAHPYNVGEDERATLVATDKAGNTREMRLSYTLKNVKYKKSTLQISEDFLRNKVTPLLNDVGARQGSPKEIFVKVNKGLRKENEDKIKAITEKSTPSKLWEGAFSQLSNSKVEANFADARTYIYNNEEIDQAYHLGYDLSVTKHYPAEAVESWSSRLRRRFGNLRQHGDHRSRPRPVHALFASEFHRRQSRRQGQARPAHRQDRRNRLCRRRSPALRRLSTRPGDSAGGMVGSKMDQGQRAAQVRRPDRRSHSTSARK